MKECIQSKYAEQLLWNFVSIRSLNQYMHRVDSANKPYTCSFHRHRHKHTDTHTRLHMFSNSHRKHFSFFSQFNTVLMNRQSKHAENANAFKRVNAHPPARVRLGWDGIAVECVRLWAMSIRPMNRVPTMRARAGVRCLIANTFTNTPSFRPEMFALCCASVRHL